MATKRADLKIDLEKSSLQRDEMDEAAMGRSVSPKTDNRTPEVIPQNRRDAIKVSLEQARSGRFASDADIEAVYRTF